MVGAMIPADTNGIRDKAAIVGIGETEFSWNSGRSELQLASESIKAACDDAGIAPQDIDGLVRYDMESNHETLLIQSLGIKNLRHWESVSYGGGAGNAVIGHAAAAVAAGFCNYVVCFRAANLRSGLRLGPGQRSGANSRRGAELCRSLGRHGAGASFRNVRPALHARVRSYQPPLRLGRCYSARARPPGTPALSGGNPSPSTITRIPVWSWTRCTCWTSARKTTALLPS